MNTPVHSSAPAPLVTVDADHPWLGLAAFTEETQRFFFGRDAEIAEIFVRVRDNTLTILYGQSGLGKSSLLGAGLLPKLRVEDYRPVQIRLRYDVTDPPLLDQVFTELEKASPLGTSYPATLWEWLHHRESRPGDFDSCPPVLVFDQFEEIFTLGQRAERLEETRALFTQLAELIENRTPAALRARFQEDRRLARDYDNTATPARLVITLREDFLSHLEQWKKILPSLMKNRMALDLLDGPQALEAVVRPGQMEGRSLVDEEVGAAIVRFVAKKGPQVPLDEIGAVPPLLSLVCDELNRLRLAQNLPTITADLVESQSSDILNNFYYESFANLPDAVRHFIEDRLITEGGHRNPVAQEDALTAFRRAGVENPAAALDQLVARRLISPEERGGLVWIEITHDVLAPLVVRSRDERLERERAAEAEKKEGEARKARNKLRNLLCLFSLLTLLAVAGAIYGFTSSRETAAALMQVESALGQLEQKKEEADEALSNSITVEAERLLDDDEANQALALFAHALRINPGNSVSAQRIIALLTERNFALPVARAPLDGEAMTPLQYLGLTNKNGRLYLPGPAGGSPVPISETYNNKKAVYMVTDSGRKFAAVLWHDQNASLFDNSTGQNLGGSLNVQSSTTRPRLVFAPDGRQLWVAGLGAATTRCWDTDPLSERTSFVRHRSTVYNLAFRPDGRMMASVARDGTGRIWDSLNEVPATEPIMLVAAAGLDDYNTMQVGFSKDGQFLIGPNGGSSRVWEVAPRQALPRSLTVDGTHITKLTFSDDSRWVAGGTVSGLAAIWETASGRPVCSTLEHHGSISDIALSPDGHRLATASEDGTVILWDIATAKQVGNVMDHGGAPVISIKFSPTGHQLATAAGTDDGFVRIWDGFSGGPVTPPLNQGGSMTFVQFSPDGTKIAAGGYGAGCFLWDASSGKKLYSLNDHTTWNAKFSNDGKLLVMANSGSDDALIVEVASGKPLPIRFRHSSGVWWAEFNSDGSRLATASLDGTARVWDVASGRPLSEPLRHEKRVDRACFTPDGRNLLTASDDHTARVWDVDTGRPVSDSIPIHGGFMDAAMSPDGRYIATAGRDGLLMVRDWISVGSQAPSWLADLAEAVGGQRVGASGVLEVDPTILAKLARARESAAASSSDLSAWANWFFADRQGRMISPLAELKLDEYVSTLVQRNDPKALAEAWRLSACDPHLLAAYARAVSLINPSQSEALYSLAKRLAPDQVLPEILPAKIHNPSDLNTLKEEIGKIVVVEGKVVASGTNKDKRILYLNFSKNYEESLTLIMFTSDSPKEFVIDRIEDFVGKRLRVQGRISEYRGALQLRISKLADIKVLDINSEPER